MSAYSTDKAKQKCHLTDNKNRNQTDYSVSKSEKCEHVNQISGFVVTAGFGKVG